METLFGMLSFMLSFGFTIPYAIDIARGRAKPARSTRILFLILMTVILIVQGREFTSWVLALTVAEVMSQILLFGLSMKHGVGGVARLDIICYAAFTVSLSAYLLTKDAVLSLTLLILTDLIGFLPTLVKTWRDPSSETWPYYFFGGVIAAAASVLASATTAYVELAFPIYICAANGVVTALILLRERKRRRSRHQPVAPL